MELELDEEFVVVLDNPNVAVIAAFVCTIIVVIITTMFLSCFRKKKGDKKKKDGKKNAPTSPPSPAAPVTSDATDDAKHPVKVENHTKDGDATDDIKLRSEEATSCLDSNDALGDFSAVRETEILRSYRKPPPPQNRARQSRAPRALKSSAENLDIFSEHNVNVFEFNKDATIKPSGLADKDEPQHEKDNDEIDNANNEIDEDARVKMRGSSQGRSSMLEDINNTLASIHLEATSVPAGAAASVEKKAQEVKEEITTKLATTLNTQVEEEVKTVKEEIKEDVVSDLKLSVEETQKQVEKSVVVDVNASVISTSIDDAKDAMEEEDIEDEIEKQENEIEEKAGGWQAALEEKSAVIVNGINGHLVNGGETTKVAGEIEVEHITCEVKETVESKVNNTIESKVNETLAGILSDPSPKDDVTLPNNHVEEVIEKSMDESEESTKREVKIPPKVSPKPSPKIKPKSIFQNSTILTEAISAASPNTEPSPPETNEEKMNNHEKVVEKIDSPPATPTSPTSPTSTSKSQSRIPMSKKASGIPKLAFNSSKSSSASPLASPDSTANKRLEQAEEIACKVQTEVEKAANVGNDLNKTVQEDISANSTSDQPESEMSRSTTSPFNENNRDSKRKLTKLRYSGRKKSSESKSDESGSDRGSRAGSEAKSDDGKKTIEDSEVDKNSRIPVRGGSKPRSSPPKALGNK